MCGICGVKGFQDKELILQAFFGYVKKRDRAWFFPPLACLITLGVYGLESIRSLFFKRMEARERWE